MQRMIALPQITQLSMMLLQAKKYGMVLTIKTQGIRIFKLNEPIITMILPLVILNISGGQDSKKLMEMNQLSSHF